MLGGMETAFAMTLDYLKTRQQFGAPIGSFQALKHRAAVLFTEIELARSAVLAAAMALDEGHAQAAQFVSAAKARCSDTFVLAGQRGRADARRHRHDRRARHRLLPSSAHAPPRSPSATPRFTATASPRCRATEKDLTTELRECFRGEKGLAAGSRVPRVPDRDGHRRLRVPGVPDSGHRGARVVAHHLRTRQSDHEHERGVDRTAGRLARGPARAARRARRRKPADERVADGGGPDADADAGST
jgi:hypothetical protein